MSRRSRHGRNANAHAPGPRPAYHAGPAPERPATPANGAASNRVETTAAITVSPDTAVAHAPAVAATVVDADVNVRPGPAGAVHTAPVEPASPSAEAPALNGSRPPEGDWGAPRTTCTTAQLRRFIKSRPWVPLHELRRRFGISGDDDDVSPIRVGDQHLFVGLPPAEARMVGELLSGGDVGYELSLDPTAPIVVGVYPMRPVPRG
ncbi:MAG TPA: hypothetical protein VGM28_09980 [Candidatus Limnocylindrales bacterium]|jgi:hypothetical protein